MASTTVHAAREHSHARSNGPRRQSRNDHRRQRPAPRENAATEINTRCDPCDPISGMKNMLNSERARDRSQRVGGIHPADQSAGILSPVSDSDDAAASASGKLAPQSSAAGKIAQTQRIRSSWKLNQMLDDRLRIDRPVRKRLGQHVRGPGDRAGQQQLAQPQRQSRPRQRRCSKRPQRCCRSPARPGIPPG